MYQGLSIITLALDIVDLILNDTFAATHIFSYCPYDSDSPLRSITWDCHGKGMDFGPLPILLYCSSNLDSPQSVCGIPKFGYHNCPGHKVGLSCEAQKHGKKFHKQSTGPGVFSVTGTVLAPSSSPSPARAGSNMTLLYLLFLLFLIPICLLLLWLGWKTRQKKPKAAKVNREETPNYNVIERGYLQPLATGSTPHPSPAQTPVFPPFVVYQKAPLVGNDTARFQQGTMVANYPAATPWWSSSTTAPLQPRAVGEPLAPAAWPMQPTSPIQNAIRAQSPTGLQGGYLVSQAPAAAPFNPSFTTFQPPPQSTTTFVGARPVPF
jgi:hypothetical protein